MLCNTRGSGPEFKCWPGRKMLCSQQLISNLSDEIISQVLSHLWTIPDEVSTAGQCPAALQVLFTRETLHVRSQWRKETSRQIKEKVMWVQVLAPQEIQTSNHVPVVPEVWQHMFASHLYTPSMRIELCKGGQGQESRHANNIQKIHRYDFPFSLDSLLYMFRQLVKLQSSEDHIRFGIANEGGFEETIQAMILPVIKLQQYFTNVEIIYGFEISAASRWFQKKELTFAYVDDLAAVTNGPHLHFNLYGDIACLYAQLPTVIQVLGPKFPTSHHWVSAIVSDLSKENWAENQDNKERIRRLRQYFSVVLRARLGYCRIVSYPEYNSAFATLHTDRVNRLRRSIPLPHYGFLSPIAWAEVFIVESLEHDLYAKHGTLSRGWSPLEFRLDFGSDLMQSLCYAALAGSVITNESVVPRIFCSLARDCPPSQLSLVFEALKNNLKPSFHLADNGTLRYISYQHQGLLDAFDVRLFHSQNNTRAWIFGDLAHQPVSLSCPVLDRCFERCGNSCSFFSKNIEFKILKHNLAQDDGSEFELCPLRVRLAELSVLCHIGDARSVMSEPQMMSSTT